MDPTLGHIAYAGDAGAVPAVKTIVFSLLKSDGRLYTAMVSNASKTALQAVIRGRTSVKSVSPY